MGNRILKETICTSDTIDQLSPEEERLFYRLLVKADDYGLLDGRVAVIRSGCFPLKVDEISAQQVQSWLAALEQQQLLRAYVVDGRPYYQVTSWKKHQQIRNKKSRFPFPEDAESPTKPQPLPDDDINSNQLISSDINCSSRALNPIQSNPKRNQRAQARESLSDFVHDTGWNSAIPSDLHEPLAQLEAIEQAAHPDKRIPFVLSEPQQLRLVRLTQQRMTWDAIRFVVTDQAAKKSTWSYAMGVLAGMLHEGKHTLDDVMGMNDQRASPQGKAGPALRTIAELEAKGALT